MSSSSSSPPVVVRSKIVAAILALVAPGLGHVYVGHMTRGGLWALAPLLAVVLFLTMSHESSPLSVLGVLVGAAFIAYVGGAADVVAMPKRKYRAGSPVVMIGFGIAAFVAAPVLGGITRALVLEALSEPKASARASLLAERSDDKAFKVPSGAMIPTVLIGDHLFVDKVSISRAASR